MANQIIDKVLEEINTNVTILNLGKIIINTLIIFVFFFLISILFGFSYLIGLIPSVGYLIYALIRDFRGNKFAAVEGKFPVLNERLRTVADNLHKSNEIIDSLKHEVYNKLNIVRVGEFIDFKAITIRLLVLTVLSLIVVVISFSNVNFDGKLGSFFPSIPGFRVSSGDLVDPNLEYIKASNLSEIYGNSSLAILGNRQLDLILNPLQGSTDLSRNEEASDAEFDAPNFPKEIYTSYDTAYSESISKDRQKVVKDYFENIAG